MDIKWIGDKIPKLVLSVIEALPTTALSLLFGGTPVPNILYERDLCVR
jgi:hypothetical protein